MKLKTGDRAVNFRVKDINSSSIELNNYLGGKVLLSFYQYTGCPLCN